MIGAPPSARTTPAHLHTQKISIGMLGEQHTPRTLAAKLGVREPQKAIIYVAIMGYAHACVDLSNAHGVCVCACVCVCVINTSTVQVLLINERFFSCNVIK